jgi:sugar/nucleoside kinase (ribokinase family)
MSILIVGSIAFDSIKTPFGEVQEVLGGSAVYSSISASFFSPVKIVGVVGEDFSEEYFKLLEKYSIDTSAIERKPGRTFRWSGEYEYDINCVHTLDLQLNVFSDFHPKIPEKFKNTPYIFLANIDPELQLEVLNQIERKKLVIADTRDHWIETKNRDVWKVIRNVDGLVINESETRQLANDSNLIKSVKKILKEGLKFIIVKKGEHGALVFDEKNMFFAPGYPLEDVKDPTGAGDCFAGGFLGYIAYTGDFSFENLRRAVIYGSVIASYNVEGFGLERLLKLKEDEIFKRFNEFKNLTHFEDIS